MNNNFCKNCGTPIQPGAFNCSSCGFPINQQPSGLPVNNQQLVVPQVPIGQPMNQPMMNGQPTNFQFTPPPQYAEDGSALGFGIGSMACGLIGWFFFSLLAIVGLILGILGVKKAKNRTDSNSKTGKVLSIIGIIGNGLLVLLIIVAIILVVSKVDIPE